MTLAARLAALERRHPPPSPPAPATDAQRAEITRRLCIVYDREGREGVIWRLAGVCDPEEAARSADAIAALVSRLQER